MPDARVARTVGERLPLVPKSSAIGGLALILAFMTFVGTALYLSYAGRDLPPRDQLTVMAAAGVLVLVLGGVAWAFFIKRGGD